MTHVSYSVLEEMKRGSVIGNIAKDLGLDLGRLSARKARVDTEDNNVQYCGVNLNTGDLIVQERIDREGLCARKASCVLKQELVLENPLELHRISIRVQDINDNSPQFKEDYFKIEIHEMAGKGSRFLLGEAHDADIGENAVQGYSLQQNDHFKLDVNRKAGGRKYCELILEKELDREDKKESMLLLTAFDGGSPQRSGTVAIHITITATDEGSPPLSSSKTVELSVADINDNPPVFEEQSYSAYVTENNKPGSTLCSVSARDPDWRQNGTVIYSLLAGEVNGAPVSSYLSVNGDTGVIHAVRSFDYEQFRSFKVQVMARDNGSPPLSSNVTVSVFISDMNDNSPQILYPAPEGNSFMTELVPKAAHGGSLVSKVIAVDADSGQNAWLSYHIVKSTDLGLFTIGLHSGEIRTQRDISESDSMKQNLIVAVKDNGQPSLSATCSMYLLISDNLAEVPELKDRQLDRELVSDYNITITATDEGSPPLSSSKTVELSVADINDNPPVFEEQAYSAYVTENNKPGSTLCSVTARDPDWRQNGTVIYSLLAGGVNGAPVSSYLSVNGDTGVIHAVRSFDYEQFRSFNVHVMARDNGSPPLSSNVTVSVFISDVNDNSPQILYPAPEGNSFMTELVPKAAHGGSLVSKVIAVDADSGQNAWLSYHIVKSTDPGLFTIGLHSGEIRTERDISESDSMKQNLIVAVKDNGQPSLSATCSMYLLISDNLAEVPELKDISYDEKNSKLTSYLIIALVCVSTFFLTFIIIILGVRFCRRRKPRLLFDGAVAIPSAYLPPNYADVDGTGTLRSTYNYDAYLTTGSRTSDFKFVTSYNDNTLPADQTLKKSLTDFADAFGDVNESPEVGTCSMSSVPDL
ncbi:protocadherin beta-16-like [Seriola lalandi dorsalis]|uniref:protocadherin beta-16-like n=1 Tax=Seriola lalandi dorsalis TaxID=1841481 RepID=UPI000C6FB8BF|nr:protocadherin beta-16-like [Seriola lalandi dorsalis]